MNIEKAIDLLSNGESDERMSGFIKYYANKLWAEYNEYLMNEIVVIENKVKELPIVIPNASIRKPYNAIVSIPCEEMTDITLSGLTEEVQGLKIEKQEDGKSFKISGTPKESGTFDVTLRYKYRGLSVERPYLERMLQIIINPDPRDLWKDIPVPEDMEYPKDNTAKEYVKVAALSDGTPQKILWLQAKEAVHMHKKVSHVMTISVCIMTKKRIGMSLPCPMERGLHPIPVKVQE